MSESNESGSQSGNEYWKANLKLVRNLLIIWAIVSFGCGLLFRPVLGLVKFGGADLGFWFAQQGSIYVFLILIFYYAWKMKQIDREFNVNEEE